ncbi:uncharacterized protein LOC128736523 [Sabethes cyaneus]|uniref:uncharacterized protein LOC128736523 n=1 Tax=Sabethes cyaneus TaxID=53552 RepID=UPI00237D6845|nr:uncharacterized protein LOC128736523 [Sabethes cyaneus]
MTRINKRVSAANHSTAHFRANLTHDQIAARQVIPRDLPKFGGDPEEWPIFISTFESTTQMCGYREEENMIRLRNCLKDDALIAVRSFLMHPASVPKAINTLKMRFGQPHCIIRVLREKVLSVAPVRAEAMDKLIDFALAVQNLCTTIDVCGRKEYKRDATLLQELVGKLPASIRLDWARYQKTIRKVDLFTFNEWIYAVAEDACLVSDIQSSKTKEYVSNRKGKAYINAHSEHTFTEASVQRANSDNQARTADSESTKMCPICKNSCRNASKCSKFLGLSYGERWSAVKNLKICRRCLRQHKGACNAQPCGKEGCTFKHHELLHKVFSVTDETEKGIEGQEHSVHTHLSTMGGRMFRYLPVRLYGRDRQVECYAFLDDGSELSLIDREIADHLRISGSTKPLCLKWTGGTHRYESESRCIDIEISGSSGRRFCLEDVRTVDALQLPEQTVDFERLSNSFPYLAGLPVHSYKDVRPRILIGLKHANITLVRKSREGKQGEPIAVKTLLGWTVYGGYTKLEPKTDFHYTYHVCECNQRLDDDLHRAVKDYFSLESIGIAKQERASVSDDVERSLRLLQTHTKLIDGRYETALLWRFEDIRLPDSRPMAIRRFKCLEKRMERDQMLAQALQDKIDDYRNKGYIRELSVAEMEQRYRRVWYLPVFPVFNPNKPGKVRIVWDAAASVHGVSLNSALLTGPDELASLPSVLFKFREFRFAVVGDIREMFHQVLIRPEDQQCQRFLWRNSCDEEPKVYITRVMTFGACSSPSTAQFIKNRNAERFKAEYPRAVEAVISKHYVDDLLASEETEEAAIELAKSVRFVHAQGGFEIRNWLSNSQRVLAALNHPTVKEKNMNLQANLATEKVLGMFWNTQIDCFTYKLSRMRIDKDLLNGSRRPTKREVLRTLMSIFDPLGLISQFLMHLKITLQDIWRTGVKWDEQIETKQFESWKIWVTILPELENLSIPRCYRQKTSIIAFDTLQMHCFVDASEHGMAAVVYLRFEESGEVECTMIAAKTRVAPLKYMSIPRLELQAAIIGTRLAESVTAGLTVIPSKRFFWSDSRNVLCWLRSDQRRYSPFVAARVSEILEVTEIHDWKWVPTKCNVADDGTRWKRQPDMNSNGRWYKGPEFLWKGVTEWPEMPFNDSATEEELRPSVLFHTLVMEPLISAHKYCSWKKLIRVTACVFRIVSNWKLRLQKQSINCSPFTSEELKRAEQYNLRLAQHDVYSDEIAILEKGRKSNQPTKIPKNSVLFKYSPILDDNGVLRMQGRAKECKFLDIDEKYPIILPVDHPVTRLLIISYRQKFHHRNFETAINEMRQRFAIARLRVAFKKARRNCQWCKNRDAVPRPPQMAVLPPGRLAAYTQPFSHVGVDYFGPIEVTVGRRVEKRWGVLLTCLTTRAVHIEVACSLSTTSCIMALRNFVGRRGPPLAFYSDRGTNFVGADRKLRHALEAINQEEIINEFTNPDTAWIFNPPASPHMGGSWERLIQAVKRNLIEILGTKRPNDEELRNVLIEIESMLNARPLTYVPIDEESAPALTPNHLLFGSSGGMKPLSLCDDSAAMVRRGWQMSQVMANQFWQRWLREYLPVITRRSKWHEKVKPIQVGDIVVIVDPNLPRNCWPKGRVIDVMQRDGQVRRATVQTSKGLYERPAVKLAVLDITSTERGDSSDGRLERYEANHINGIDSPGGSVTNSSDTNEDDTAEQAAVISGKSYERVVEYCRKDDERIGERVVENLNEQWKHVHDAISTKAREMLGTTVAAISSEWFDAE